MSEFKKAITFYVEQEYDNMISASKLDGESRTTFLKAAISTLSYIRKNKKNRRE